MEDGSISYSKKIYGKGRCLAYELSGAAYITEIDLASGYWNIWITKKDRYKTAFQLPDGRVYQWTRFPFGLDISGSVFCMIIMTKCIRHHLHKRALAYSDNIYVYTMETDLSAHLRDVALVLADLEKNGITAKPSKSFFAMQRLRVIGLIVSKLGIQVNPDRLQAITEFQMPKSKTAVRRLLGMANHTETIYTSMRKLLILCVGSLRESGLHAGIAKVYRKSAILHLKN